MGSVTSALSRSRNTVVQLSSEPGAAQEAKRSVPGPGKLGGAKIRSREAPDAPALPAFASGAWVAGGEKQEEQRELSAVLKSQAEDSSLPPSPILSALANETGDKNARPLSRFSRSKSQNCLWNNLIDGLTGNLKEKQKPTIIHDPRTPEEILADELPPVDSPDALVKTSFRFDGHKHTLLFLD